MKREVSILGCCAKIYRDKKEGESSHQTGKAIKTYLIRVWNSALVSPGIYTGCWMGATARNKMRWRGTSTPINSTVILLFVSIAGEINVYAIYTVSLVSKLFHKIFVKIHVKIFFLTNLSKVHAFA